jgi:hypothetical protein
MSKPVGSPARPVPVGILVTDAAPARKAKSPPDVPLAKRQWTVPKRPDPWIWIVTAGSALWALVLMLIVARTGTAGNEPAREPDPPRQQAIAAIAPAPTHVVDAAPSAPADEDLKAVIEAPALRARPLPLPESVDLPPPVEIVPDVAPTLTEPVPPPAPEPKRPRKAVDLTVFANCEAIGTDVLFVKDPPEAFRRARQEKKLVYVMHLSGNLEDKDFT